MMKDISNIIMGKIGFEKFIWLITFVMMASFIVGIILGLNKVNS